MEQECRKHLTKYEHEAQLWKEALEDLQKAKRLFKHFQELAQRLNKNPEAIKIKNKYQTDQATKLILEESSIIGDKKYNVVLVIRDGETDIIIGLNKTNFIENYHILKSFKEVPRLVEWFLKQ